MAYLFPYNTTLRQFVSGAGSNIARSADTRLKRRDAAELALRLESGPGGDGTVALQLATGFAMTFALKKVDDFTGPAVVMHTDWVYDEDAGAYLGSPGMNTYRMSQYFVQATGLNVQATNYTLAATDAVKLVVPSAAAAITIPTNAAVPIAVNTVVYLLRGSAGAVTISASGITISYLNDLTSDVLTGLSENVVYKLKKTATDTWELGLATELPSITMMAEWSWSVPGVTAPTSTETITFTIENDVIRGDEGSPLNSEDPLAYYTSAQCDTLFFLLANAGALAVKDSIATADVDANAITNAKLAQMITASIKGRATAGTGAPEDLTLSQVLDMIGSAAHGDMLYRGASGWQRLAAGTSGYYLKALGAAAPAWAALPAPADGSIGAAKLTSILTPGTYDLERATLAAGGLITAFTERLSAVVSAAVPTGATTGDNEGLTLAIPANRLTVGRVLTFRLYGTTNNSTTASNWLPWVKCNGTKSGTGTFAMGTTAASNVPWMIEGQLTVLTGSTNNLRMSASVHWKANSSGFTGLWTVDLTNIITLIIGSNCSVATGVAISSNDGLIELK